MERRFTPEQVARHFGVSKGTVIGWCEAGLMPAVNVASPTAVRKRWRMSEDDIDTFRERRANKPGTSPASAAAGRRHIRRPTRDYLSGGQR